MAIDTAAPGGSGGRIVARRDGERHRQLALAVGRPQREAVERGVVPAGQVDERVVGLGEHPSEGLSDGHVLGLEARARRAEPVARFAKPE